MKLLKCGHCRLQGHGQRCEVAHDRTAGIRARDRRGRRRQGKAQVQEQLDELEESRLLWCVGGVYRIWNDDL